MSNYNLKPDDFYGEVTLNGEVIQSSSDETSITPKPDEDPLGNRQHELERFIESQTQRGR